MSPHIQHSVWQEHDDADVPLILQAGLFHMKETERQHYIDLYNSKSQRIRERYRRALDTDYTDKFREEMRESYSADGNFIVSLDGKRRSGKSTMGITFSLWGRDEVHDLFGIVCSLVWRRNYAGINEAIAKCEDAEEIGQFLKDEDEHLQREMALTNLWTFIDRTKQTGILKHSFYMCDVHFQKGLLEFVDFRVRALGYGVVVYHGVEGDANLGIVHDSYNNPLGFIIAMKDQNYPEIYDAYREYKLRKEHGRARMKAGVAAMDENERRASAKKILDIYINMFPDDHKASHLHFLQAHTASKCNLVQGDLREEVWGIMRDAYNKIVGYVPGQRQDKQSLKENGEEIEQTHKKLPKSIDEQEPALMGKTATSKIHKVTKQERYNDPKRVEETKKDRRLGGEWELEFRDRGIGSMLYNDFHLTCREPAPSNKEKRGAPDGNGIDKKDKVFTVISLEIFDGCKSRHPNVDYIEISDRLQDENNRVRREIISATYEKDTRGQAKLMLHLKEISRNYMYCIPIDFEHPSQIAVHFDDNTYHYKYNKTRIQIPLIIDLNTLKPVAL